MLLGDQEAVRFANTSDLNQYLGLVAEPTSFQMIRSRELTAHAELDVVGRDEAFEESLFLGLRLNEGVDLKELRRQFGDALLKGTMPALIEVRDAGLLELHPDRIRLTPQGRLLSNEVFSRLLIPTAA
jgi:oxygen-independent coproporphyrinogen-3 oxidase